MNSSLLFVSVDLLGKSSNVDNFDPVYANDVFVSGYSEQILRFIAERNDFSQLEYVRSIDQIKGLPQIVAPLSSHPGPPSSSVQQEHKHRNRGVKHRLRQQAKERAVPGTSFSSSYSALASHIRFCSSTIQPKPRLVSCPNGCSTQLNELDKQTFDQHVNSACLLRKVKCRNPHCHAMVSAQELESHEISCRYKRFAQASSQGDWQTVNFFISSTFLDMHGLLRLSLFPVSLSLFIDLLCFGCRGARCAFAPCVS